MYYPPRLAVLAATNAVLFLAMLPAMRAVERMLAAHVAPGVWWRMAALPLLLVLTLLIGAWLPPLNYARLYFCLSFVLAVDAVLLVLWMLHMVRTAVEQANRQAMLERALRDHANARETLASELVEARERVAALERLAAQGESVAPPRRAPQPIVLSTPTRAVSFLPDEVTHVDSLNRVRSVHFANGESVPIDMTLAAIVEALPCDRFAYCHRSIVVNLGHVRQVATQEVVLDTGERLPVSRRRLTELREALAKRIGRAAARPFRRMHARNRPFAPHEGTTGVYHSVAYATIRFPNAVIPRPGSHNERIPCSPEQGFPSAREIEEKDCHASTT